jgi:cytochrome P450
LPPGPSTPYDLETGDDKLNRLQSLWQQYGDCFRVPAVSRDADTWVITEPDWIRRILVSNHRNYCKGVGIERVRVLLGNGLMASEGEQWRRQRRLIQPAFHRAALERYFPVYHRQAQILVARWRQAAREGRAVNVTEAVSETTLAAVLEALFSEDLAGFCDAQGRLPFQLVSEDRQRDLQFAVRFRALGATIRQIADARRREQRYPPDLLSHCLLARERGSDAPMSDRQLVDEVLTLIVAGHETTAASLNWAWYLLSSHPEQCRQLRESVSRYDVDRVPEWQTLQRWQPVQRVVKEALRLYPPGWLYTRRALQDDRFGDYRMPAGTDVFICSWLLHRHPGYWEVPEAFRPERFTPEQEQRRHRYAYLPFSAGPRHCIGETFAMAEMLIHLAVIAAQLRPLALEKSAVALETGVNLRPREPLFLHFEALHG